MRSPRAPSAPTSVRRHRPSAAASGASAAPERGALQTSAHTRRSFDTTPVGTKRDHSRLGTLKRTLTELQEDNLTDWAGALTYYGLLALFPAMIALVSLIGLFGDPRETTRTVTAIVTGLGPESAAETFRGPIESITSNRGTAGLLFVQIGR